MTRFARGKTIVRSVVVLAALVAMHGSAGQPVAVPSDKAEIARLLALGGEGFRIRGSDRFLIASDGDDSVVNAVAERLEGAYQAVARFRDGLQLPIHPPPRRLPVLLFSRHASFEQYARTVGFDDPITPGFYHSPSNTAAFCNVLDLPNVREISQRIEQAEARRDPPPTDKRITEWRAQRDALVETFNRLVVQHEAAHQVLFNIGVLLRGADNPDWLVEGLACQFEVPLRDADRTRANPMRLADFRDALGTAPGAIDIDEQSLRDSHSKGRVLPLVDLVGGAELRTPDESGRTYRYAQAWALVDYLHRTRGEAFAAYLRRIAGRPPNERTDRQHRITEFQSVFGPLDQAFERLWIESVLKLPFDPRQTGR